jgi:hypothetical protein
MEMDSTIIKIFAVTGSFIWAVSRYFNNKSEERHNDEFKQFQLMLKELNQVDEENNQFHRDHQSAILFELNHYKRYYPFTLRTLKALRNDSENILKANPRFLLELDMSIAHIEKNL